MKRKISTIAILFLFNIGFAQTPVLLKNLTIPSSINSYPSYYTEYKGKTIFTSMSDLSVGEFEVWISDGTSAGTNMLKNIGAIGESSLPSGYHVFKDKIYFKATSDGRNSLWVTDGTSLGTIKITDVGFDGPMNLKSNSLVEYNDKLYFKSHDYEFDPKRQELWVTDGTAAGTKMVKDINVGSLSSNPEFLTVYKDRLYFQADDGINGIELWVTDGTETGTVLFKDINKEISNSSSPRNFFIFKDKLYFEAYEPSSGIEWWVTDGTLSGTKIFKDINPGASSGLRYINVPVIIFKDKFYFSASDGTNGYELWSSDGTESGTRIVKEINTFGDSHPGDFCEYKGVLYFQADDGINGKELWVSDGTSSGTKLFLDLNGGKDGLPGSFVVYDSLLYFIANISSSDPPDLDLQLWVTDGDIDNTKVISAIGATAKNPFGFSQELKVCNNLLFMQAGFENTIGLEPYIINTIPLKIKSECNYVNQLEVYPNPTNEIVHLKNTEGIRAVKILNSIGMNCYTNEFKGEQEVKINLTNYPSGIYTLIVYSANSYITKIISKQ